MKEKWKEYGIITAIVAVLTIAASFYYFTQPNEQPNINGNLNNVEILTEETSYMYIDIKGEVYNPGVYKVEIETRLYQLIYKAGGLTELADEAAINLSLILLDEHVIYIPSFDDEFPTLGLVKEETDPAVIDQFININTASKEELMTLPGIGESTANTIIEYRINNGLFDTTENIKDVPGIGDATFENIKTLITV
jgi:competence protein ComEA